MCPARRLRRKPIQPIVCRTRLLFKRQHQQRGQWLRQLLCIHVPCAVRVLAPAARRARRCLQLPLHAARPTGPAPSAAALAPPLAATAQFVAWLRVARRG